MASSGQFDAVIQQNIGKYTNRDQTQRDMQSVFAAFKDLRPKLDSHVFNDGKRKELICIDGTIPVLYKANTYNIPICVWILETHPHNPPLCFVRPTSTMLIKPSKHVDANGRVYLPYLHDWKPNNSDLVGLIQVMTVVFGESSPVYAKSAGQPPPRPSYTPQGGGMPQHPSYPQPQQSSFMPMPMPAPANASSGYSQPQPQYPPSTNYQPPAVGGSGYTPGYQGSSGYPYPYQPGQATPGQQTQSQPSYSPAAMATASTAGSHPQVSSQSSLSDDAIKASLQSAVEDKLKRKLKENSEKFQAEMDSLTATKEKLKNGQRKLEEIINQLESETAEVRQNTQLLKQKDEEIKAALSKMEGRDELDLDDSVVPTAPLYKQLLNLFAEEMTIEDTYYYLMEGLKKDVISIDEFTKNVRELSRKQFLLRAHIQKVRQTAGLREITPL
ncbi:tumor susceptibility gene 101 protein [Strongylocentrotus purpuratus]|uniref:Tumor susceptibility gene 101 protein n=1 Tax=Strongylocentrotus purpuratus TaxID=7668 RepID=A0A7M7SZX9_STRPU|nr:tumor susceptibility gene 101 protein [Strongylocentrotus purpuratus]